MNIRRKLFILGVAMIIPALFLSAHAFWLRTRPIRPIGTWALPVDRLKPLPLGTSLSKFASQVPNAKPGYMGENRILVSSDTPPWTHFFFGFTDDELTTIAMSGTISSSDDVSVRRLIADITSSLAADPLIAVNASDPSKHYLWRSKSELVHLYVGSPPKDRPDMIALIVTHHWVSDPYLPKWIEQVPWAPIDQERGQ